MDKILNSIIQKKHHNNVVAFQAYNAIFKLMKPLKQWPKVLTQKSFAKRIYSYWQFWVLVLVLSLGAWQASVHIEEWGNSSRDRIADTEGIVEYMKYIALVEHQDNLISTDTYGGTTPQETWDMFITALEAGDTDLASKYFVVWKQDEWKDNFKIGKENGVLESFLNDDLMLIIGSNMYPDGKRFEYYTDSINGGANFVYTLVLNESTNIWKIESI